MRLLLTGSTGFVGRHAAGQLLDLGIEVVAAGRSAPTDPRCGFVHADLLIPGAAENVLRAVRPTHLLHLAWEATPGRFWTSNDNLVWCSRSLELFHAFYEQGGRRAIGAGTCAEYDWLSSPLDEHQTELLPGTLYGFAKKAVFELISAYTAQNALSFAWARLFWMYGPHEAPRRLVSDLSSALVHGLPAEMGPGLARRDYLHVYDVAGALVAALTSDYCGPFNVASGEAVALREIGALLARAFGKESLLRIGARPGVVDEAPEVKACTAILHERIGFTPRWSLGEGLEHTARWWQSDSVAEGE